MRIFVRIKYKKLISYFLLIELFIFIGCENKELTSQNDEIGLENYESTYAVIQGEIFDQYCISCHIAGHPTADESQSDLILTAEDYKKSKPNPEPYIKACKILKCNPKKSFVAPLLFALAHRYSRPAK